VFLPFVGRGRRVRLFRGRQGCGQPLLETRIDAEAHEPCQALDDGPRIRDEVFVRHRSPSMAIELREIVERDAICAFPLECRDLG
jgi:hypothetical protein